MSGRLLGSGEHPHELPEPFCTSDVIAQDLGDWNDAENQLEAGRIVNAAIWRHLDLGEDFGFERTDSGRSRSRIVQTAASNGYEVRAVFIGTKGVETNIERVRQRVRSGTGHDVPLTQDYAAVVISSEQPVRNGRVTRGHRRARQQPRRDQTHRGRHEGRNQVAGNANARVGAGVDSDRSNSSSQPHDENRE